MAVDSLPLDPAAMDTLPFPHDFEIPQALTRPAPAEMPLSELDKRILELQSFGCLPAGVFRGVEQCMCGVDHPSMVA